MIGINDLQIFAADGDWLLFHNASYQEAVTRVINLFLQTVPNPSKYQLHCYTDRIELFESGSDFGMCHMFSQDEYDPLDETAADFELGVIRHETDHI